MSAKNVSRKPRVRFPEFSDAWETKPLSYVLTVKGKRNYDNKYGKEHVLSVSGELGIVNQIEHLGRSYAGVVVDNYHTVEHGDVVYTKSPLRSNPYGIIKANKGPPGIVSTLYAVYEVKDGHNFSFWDRYFELDERTNNYLMPLVHKGAKNDMKINNERVLIDPIYVPSFPEQTKIAMFFDLLDRKLAILKRKRGLLAEYKRGVLQKLFAQELRFKQPDGSMFPSWEEKFLGQVASFLKGKGVSKTETRNGGGTPCIRYAELYTLYGQVINEPVSSTGEPASSLLLSEGGEVLVPASGESALDIATFACVKRAGIALGGDLNVIRLNPEIDGEFLARYLTFHRSLEVAQLAQGNSVVHLYGAQLAKIKIDIPDINEQRKIADFATVLDLKIEAVAEQITQIEAFKKALLQQMFV